MNVNSSDDLSIRKEQLLRKITKQFKELRKIQHRVDYRTAYIQAVSQLNILTVQQYDYAKQEYEKLTKKNKRINDILENELFPYFLKLFGDKILDISNLLEISVCFLKAYIESTSDDKHKVCHISKTEINEIAYVAMASYLESWLDADINCRQTLHRFAEYPYMESVKYVKRRDKEIQKTKIEPHPYATSRVKAFHSAYKDYESLFQIKLAQAENEKTFVTELPEKNGNGRLLNYTTLAWIEAHKERALNLLISLHKEIELMSISDESKKRTYLNCTDYYDYLKYINSIEITEKTSAEQLRRFVASSMMLHRLERTYHFSFNALYCRMIQKEEVSPMCFNLATYLFLMGRYTRDDLLLAPTWSDQNIPRKNSVEERHPFVTLYMQIMNYRQIIRLIHAPPPVSHSQVQEYDTSIERENFVRKAIQDLSTFLHVIYRPDMQAPWTDKIFYQVALFYKEKYPVVQELLKYTFPEPEDKDYDQFYVQYRQIFYLLDISKESEFRNARYLF